MARKLSPRQQGMLDFIADFMDEHHYPPTVRDIQDGVRDKLHLRRRLQPAYPATGEVSAAAAVRVSRGIELLDGVSRGREA